MESEQQTDTEIFDKWMAIKLILIKTNSLQHTIVWYQVKSMLFEKSVQIFASIKNWDYQFSTYSI